MPAVSALTVDGLQRQFTEVRDHIGAADTQNTRMLGLQTDIDRDRREAIEALYEGDIPAALAALERQGPRIQAAISEELGDVQTMFTLHNLVDIILRKLKGARSK